MSVEDYLLARFLASPHAANPAALSVHISNLDGAPRYYSSTASNPTFGTAGAQPSH